MCPGELCWVRHGWQILWSIFLGCFIVGNECYVVQVQDLHGCFESGVVEKVYIFLQGVGVDAYISRIGRTAIPESACLQSPGLASTNGFETSHPMAWQYIRDLECLACKRELQSQVR